MRELPVGINNNAATFTEAYKGVEDKMVRLELTALSIMLGSNKTVRYLISALTGIESDKISTYAAYIYQHLTQDQTINLLAMDIGPNGMMEFLASLKDEE